VKPRRHVVHVADLDAAETAELGPLLRRAAQALERIEAGRQPSSDEIEAFAERARPLLQG
jgi:diadenosine tetraphosphate (Ap4A) HIT family hydrolase